MDEKEVEEEEETALEGEEVAVVVVEVELEVEEVVGVVRFAADYMYSFCLLFLPRSS